MITCLFAWVDGFGFLVFIELVCRLITSVLSWFRTFVIRFFCDRWVILKMFLFFIDLTDFYHDFLNLFFFKVYKIFSYFVLTCNNLKTRKTPLLKNSKNFPALKQSIKIRTSRSYIISLFQCLIYFSFLLQIWPFHIVSVDVKRKN